KVAIDSTKRLFSNIIEINPNGALNDRVGHSGGAIGSDYVWAKVGAEFGVPFKNYYDEAETDAEKLPPFRNTPITDEERVQGQLLATRAGYAMGRLNQGAQVKDSRLVRDAAQASNAEMVFAIAEKFDNPGDRFSNKEDDKRQALKKQVSGGTGWAVEMALQQGKPVYVFDQSTNQWWGNVNGVWFECPETPTITTDNFAGIGTRQINDAGMAAIRSVYEKTAQDLEKAAQKDFSTKEITPVETVNPAIENLSPEMKKELNHITRRYDVIHKLLYSDKLSSTEARDISNKLMCYISKKLTELINDPNRKNTELKKSDYNAWLNSLKINRDYRDSLGTKKLDPTFMSRKDIINAIGIENLVRDTVGALMVENKLNMSRKDLAKAKVIQENLDAVLYLGADQLSINEGIHISYDEYNAAKAEEGVSEPIDYNSARDIQSVQENEGSIAEKWQIDSKTEDIINKMSQEVRNELSMLTVTDKNGNTLKGVLGLPEVVPIQQVTRSILNWCQGCITLSDMVHRLRQHEGTDPWVSQVLEKIDREAMLAKGINPGLYTDFQSAFFSVMNKHFQSYSATTVEYDKDGNRIYRTKPLNEKVLMKGILSDIKSMIITDAHPLFKAEGTVNQENLNKFKTSKKVLMDARRGLFAKFNTMAEISEKIGSSEVDKIYNAVKDIANLLGYPVDIDTVRELLSKKEITNFSISAENIYSDIEANKNNRDYKPLEMTSVNGKTIGIKGDLTKLIEPLTKRLQNMHLDSIYDSGKMYQSYITPSYTTKLFKKFEAEQQEFEDFMQNEYGNFPWFKDQNTDDIRSGWRSPWLERLMKDPEARKIFRHSMELNNDGRNYMKDLTPNQYIISLVTEFFSLDAGKGKENSKAKFRVPMLSNKPAAEFITFYAEMGANFKDVIADRMMTVFFQELSRIDTVRKRNLNKKDAGFIKNFDTNGGRFVFLDFLNDFLNANDKYGLAEGSQAGTNLGKLLNVKLKAENDIDEVALNSLIRTEIVAHLENKAQRIIQNYKNRGVYEALKGVHGITEGEGFDVNLEKFIWNDAFATTQIMELLITDMAFYKDMEDLQKRMAQVHAPGVRGDATAVDYEGRRVSDGYSRTFYLKDFEGVKSNIISNLKIVFDRKLDVLKNTPLDEFVNFKLSTDADIEKATKIKEERVNMMKSLYDNIVKDFYDINVTDAQGYASPTAYRKKAFIFGTWSRESEELDVHMGLGTKTNL
ncbi:MAG: hypothetical protein HUJ76_09935, partial [Parasporobacterium sp.]|nr:hypothetical protein [Parasporobacterium sp.]